MLAGREGVVVDFSDWGVELPEASAGFEDDPSFASRRRRICSGRVSIWSILLEVRRSKKEEGKQAHTFSIASLSGASGGPSPGGGAGGGVLSAGSIIETSLQRQDELWKRPK